MTPEEDKAAAENENAMKDAGKRMGESVARLGKAISDDFMRAQVESKKVV